MFTYFNNRKKINTNFTYGFPCFLEDILLEPGMHGHVPGDNHLHQGAGHLNIVGLAHRQLPQRAASILQIDRQQSLNQ